MRDHWNSIFAPPEVSKGLLILLEGKMGSEKYRYVAIGSYEESEDKTQKGYFVRNRKGSQDMGTGNRTTFPKLLGWMYVEPLLHLPVGYDPTFGDDRLCKCGDPYYRHFDTYEHMAPVGCKYCWHGEYNGIKYQKKSMVPDGVDTSTFEWEDWMKYSGICSGFQLEEGQ